MRYRKMQDEIESYLPIGAVSLAVVVIAVSDTLLYFITTAQNHIHYHCNVISNLKLLF